MERVWFQDVHGFMTEKNFMNFFPNSEMNFSEQLNALMRFALYLAAVLLLIKKDTNVLFIPIVMALITYFMYTADAKRFHDNKKILEKMGMMEDYHTKQLCQKPSKDNPFMNVLVSDLKYNPNRPRACKYDGKTKQAIKTNFDTSLYRDVDDIFHKKASDRQFYTTPITTIPNDSEAFAKWLYQTDKTCKEGNYNVCYGNLHKKMQA